ncbi:MAG TPA: SUMF1/EgtB/PvdO family nonheme iron enzyme [Thermoanaerobaculia bacterium]|nr:SUMF1/EgtB/PvdO family nonheme iron enzyme [Thermoanaerobaculia bacterium]
MANFTTVFLSSTAKDLQPWREAVAEAIGKMSGFHVIRMEDFGAVDAAPADLCRRKAAESDIFVGLVGYFNGSCPEGSELSYTQIEYEEAKRSGKPRLMFMADDDFPLSPRLGRDSEEAYQRQIQFREQVGHERVVVPFHEPQRLATLVVASLQNYQKETRGKAVTVLHGSGHPGPDEASLLKAYLGRLIEKTEFLTLRGIDPSVADSGNDPRLKLQGVYTALRTLSYEEETSRTTKDPLAEVAFRRRKLRPLSALELLDRRSRLVLLGEPGSGKSTFVNFVALCLAGEALGRSDANLEILNAPSPDQDGEDLAESRKPEPMATWSHGSLLPVRIVFRDFAARGQLPEPGEPATARHVWEFLKRELDDAGHGDFFPILKRELLAGRGLVLLDGLDEVPEAEQRRAQIRQAVEEFSSGIGSSRVLVTSRTYAYQNQAWKLKGFDKAVLAPFTRKQIDRFVGLWYEQMVALGRFTSEEAQGRAELLRRAIFASDRLLGLAERPLLLTLTASLHAWRGGSLPERREELYRDAVELLLNTWERQRVRLDSRGEPLLPEPSLAEWLKVDRQEVRQVLDELAFEAHRTQPDLAGTADLDEGRLVARLLHLTRNPGANAGQLVVYLRDRSGLLIERGNGVFTFPHRTFQEYLAACHLTGGSFPQEVAELGREDPGRWREVVLLAGAKAASGAVASVWYLADALCFREPDDTNVGPKDQWGALLAGQVVAESADLTRVGEANYPKLERLRRWLLYLMRNNAFPALERAVSGKALAVLGDPRFDPELWDLPKEQNLGFVAVPSGPFRMGSDSDDAPPFLRDESPRHTVTLPAFWLGRYPVTVGQYRAFVDASGYTPTDPGWQKGLNTQPVVSVSWFDALAYCQWLGKRLVELASGPRREIDSSSLWADLISNKLQASLPSEAEWEKAAKGVSELIYPWGKNADPNRSNYGETRLGERSVVGCFPGGASHYGIEELSGNIWEWTRSLDRNYPYEPVAIDDLDASSEIVIRGGAFYNNSQGVRCASRGSTFSEGLGTGVGFRVVLSPLSV